MSNNKKAPRLSGKAKKELKMLPGYVIIIAWVMFTFILLGWVLCASLSTTPEIFAGEVGKFPSGLHFENFAKAWQKGFRTSIGQTIMVVHTGHMERIRYMS